MIEAEFVSTNGQFNKVRTALTRGKKEIAKNKTTVINELKTQYGFSPCCWLKNFKILASAEAPDDVELNEKTVENIFHMSLI